MGLSESLPLYFPMGFRGPSRGAAGTIWPNWANPCQAPSPSCFPAYTPLTGVSSPPPAPSVYPAMPSPETPPHQNKGPERLLL